MSSSLISLALFKKKSMINFVAITWRMPGGGRSSSHLLPDNMAQNEKRCYRHRATCTSARRLAHGMLCKTYCSNVGNTSCSARRKQASPRLYKKTDTHNI